MDRAEDNEFLPSKNVGMELMDSDFDGESAMGHQYEEEEAEEEAEAEEDDRAAIDENEEVVVKIEGITEGSDGVEAEARQVSSKFTTSPFVTSRFSGIFIQAPSHELI